MVKIENNKECFVMLWRKLEHTRRLLWIQNKRYCIRRVLQSWLGLRATNDFILRVCDLCEQGGYEILHPPALYPRLHREFLRALVAVRLDIGMRSVNLKALDEAYSIAYPKSTPLNISKRPHPNPLQGEGERKGES